MSLIVAKVDFAYGDSSFQHQKTYDTAQPWVSAANTALPGHFMASGGTKTAVDAFVYQEALDGGFERVVHVGDVVPSGDPAVTLAPSKFV